MTGCDSRLGTYEMTDEIVGMTYGDLIQPGETVHRPVNDPDRLVRVQLYDLPCVSTHPSSPLHYDSDDARWADDTPGARLVPSEPVVPQHVLHAAMRAAENVNWADDHWDSVGTRELKTIITAVLAAAAEEPTDAND